MSAIKFDGQHSSIYLSVSSIFSYEEGLYLITHHNCIYGKIDKYFLSQLKIYMKINEKNYKSRKPIFLKRLKIYLPSDYNMSYLSNHLERFTCEMLEGLPVFAFIDNEKTVTVLNILVCERYMKKDDKLYIVYEDHDVYVKRKENKKGLFFCKKDDVGAILSRKKGDVKYSFYSKFTYKSRIFAGNAKTFENFVEMLKSKWATMLLPLGIIKQQRYIRGISINKAFSKKHQKVNIYWLRNIKLYNRIKCKINDDLTVLFSVIEGQKLDIDDSLYLETFKLFNKYKEVFKMNKKIYFNRCDRVETFFEDILLSWMNDYEKVLKSNYALL